MAIITLTTDLGTKDSYLASVKGSIYSQLDDAKIIDITNDITAFNIPQAAFVLRNCYKDFPEGWSFLGYYCEESQNVADVLFDITDELIIVKDYLGAAYLPEWNFNGIGMFDYGEAYQIKLHESITGLHLCPFFSTPE